MNKAVGLYERESGKGSLSGDKGLATAINLAGKQRMLTQKMSKESLLIRYGYNVEQYRSNLTDTYLLFDRTLTGLKQGDSVLGLSGTQNSTILTQLNTVSALWGEFQPLVKSVAESSSVDKSVIQQIADKNVPLLKAMNTAVKLFEKEAK